MASSHEYEEVRYQRFLNDVRFYFKAYNKTPHVDFEDEELMTIERRWREGVFSRAIAIELSEKRYGKAS